MSRLTGNHFPLNRRGAALAATIGLGIGGYVMLEGSDSGNIHTEARPHFGVSDIDGLTFPADVLAARAHGHGDAAVEECSKADAPHIKYGGFLNDVSDAVTSAANAPLCFVSKRHSSGRIPSFMYLMVQGGALKPGTYPIDSKTTGVQVTVDTNKMYTILSKDINQDSEVDNGARLPSLGGGKGAAERIDAVESAALGNFKNNCQNTVGATIEPGIENDTKALLLAKSSVLLKELGDTQGAQLLDRLAKRKIKVVFTHTSDTRMTGASMTREITAFQIRLSRQDTSKEWFARKLHVDPKNLQLPPVEKPECIVKPAALAQAQNYLKKIHITPPKILETPAT